MRAHVCRSVAGSLLISALLAGCSGNAPPARPPDPVGSSPAPSPSSSPPPVVSEPHLLVFSAKGTAKITSVTYELDGDVSTEKSAKLPWRKVVEVPADGKAHAWKLAITARGGRVELIGTFDGAVIGRSEGASGSGGQGTVSVGGDVIG